jgi:hypothetical protein
VIPFNCEARDGTEQVGFLSVARKMLDRLLDEQSRLLAGAVFAQKRDKGRFARIGIAAERLARRCFIAAMVDEVVGDLKRKADIFGKAVGRDENKPTIARKIGPQAARLNIAALTASAKTALSDFSENGFLIWLSDFLCGREQ